MAHVFSHLGKPWRSQYWVRKVRTTTFADITPFGGCNGDEDQGQMGALSALMAIGLFDMDGGASSKPRFDITASLFDRVTIQLHPTYHPERPSSSRQGTTDPKNCDIQSARLNGQPWELLSTPSQNIHQGRNPRTRSRHATEQVMGRETELKANLSRRVQKLE